MIREVRKLDIKQKHNKKNPNGAEALILLFLAHSLAHQNTGQALLPIPQLITTTVAAIIATVISTITTVVATTTVIYTISVATVVAVVTEIPDRC